MCDDTFSLNDNIFRQTITEHKNETAFSSASVGSTFAVRSATTLPITFPSRLVFNDRKIELHPHWQQSLYFACFGGGLKQRIHERLTNRRIEERK
jgi:hypothetical protein